MGKFLDKNKIESYSSQVRMVATQIITLVNSGFITQANAIIQYNLVLDGGILYKKPFINLVMNSKTIEKVIFADDASMNSFISANLTPLNFLAI